MTLSPGTRLGAYEIVSSLGAGGMGEVYRARDAKLRRDVAVKVLPPDLAQSPDALARFEREALAVAALSHPNILSIFDFGEHDGTTYAVTELLEGRTLRERLDAGPVPQQLAVDWALQVARGLAAAHGKGIVHRDLKPENLFVTTDGHVKILDFGLAKRTEPAGSDDETAVSPTSGDTQPGTVMGTMGYMSPEQVRGLPVDARGDLFSFGAVLYELLSGKRAFRGDSAADTIAAILMQEPPALSGSGRDVPPALDRVVRQCLEKRADQRIPTARDLVSALEAAAGSSFAGGSRFAVPPFPRRRLLVGVGIGLAILVAVAAALLLRPPGEEAALRTGPMRIAVLPFENLGRAEDDYFADGIADEVRGKLTSLPGLEVIARGSSIPYRKTTKSPGAIARELRVRYLLTATVRWEKGTGKGRVQVSPELVEVSGSETPASRWQQSFDAELTDVFRVQSDIATRVARALGVALGAGAERRLLEPPTEDVAAYDAFLRGEAASNSMGVTDPPSLRRALAFYEEAVGLDPEFAQAWARLATASLRLHANSVPSPALAERARQAAERSVALSPGRPEGYVAQAGLAGLGIADPGRELDLLEKARRLAPASPEVLTAVALVEQSLGRWDEALSHLRRAERLDPYSVLARRRLALAFLLLRRYPEARETVDLGLAIAPANLVLNELKVMTRLVEGDVEGAREVVRSVPAEVEPRALVAHLVHYQDLAWLLDAEQRELFLGLSPAAFDDDRGAWGLHLAHAYALTGDGARVRAHAGEARKAFEEQLRAVPDDPERQLSLGLTLAYLGRKAEAVRAGERGAALVPVAKDAYRGPLLQHQLVRIYILVREPEKALDRLEPLLLIPYTLSPEWLRIDPTFDPLRGHPRFERLLAGGT